MLRKRKSPCPSLNKGGTQINAKLLKQANRNKNTCPNRAFPPLKKGGKGGFKATLNGSFRNLRD
jgi:hypothetical protein